MGCIMSKNPDDDIDDKMDLENKYSGSSYHPANMSVSRDSTMAEYQYPKARLQGAFKVNGSPNAAMKLSTIPDLEPNEDLTLEDMHNLQKPRNSKKRVSSANGFISRQDMKQMLELDLTKDTLPLPHKRVIFTSIATLNAAIEDIPAYVLSESLFCFKAERAWFFPSTHAERKQSRQSIRHKLNLTHKFLNVLQEKDSKNLVLWLQDNKSWNNISDEIAQIQDIYYNKIQIISSSKKSENNSPTTQESSNKTTETTASEPQPDDDKFNTDTNIKKYNPLKLDHSWWHNDFKNAANNIASMYCDSADTVVEELKSCKGKFNPTRELLYQSNPTMIPMRGWDLQEYINHHYQIAPEEDDGDDDEGELVELDLGLDDDDDGGNDKILALDDPISDYIDNADTDNDLNGHKVLTTNYEQQSLNNTRIMKITDQPHQSNTITYNDLNKSNQPRINITPAPSNARATMGFLARDSAYDEDDEHDDTMYLVNEDEEEIIDGIPNVLKEDEEIDEVGNVQKNMEDMVEDRDDTENIDAMMIATQKSLSNSRKVIINHSSNVKKSLSEKLSNKISNKLSNKLSNNLNIEYSATNKEKLNMYDKSATVDSEVP